MIKRFLSTVNNYYPITITTNAWNKMDTILNKHKAYSFIFSAKSGGCNGFNYQLNLINKNEYDILLKSKPTILENNNARLIIDPIAEMILFGTTIDFVSENFNKGIFENKFTFTPDKNIATTCGCGVSFNPK